MAKINIQVYRKTHKTKRPGVHSKNASRSQNAYKPKYRGQGR